MITSLLKVQAGAAHNVETSGVRPGALALPMFGLAVSVQTSDGLIERRTKAKRATAEEAIEWDEQLELELPCNISRDSPVQITLFRYHVVAPRSEVGRATIPLEEFVQNGANELMLFHEGTCEVVARGRKHLPAVVHLKVRLAGSGAGLLASPESRRCELRIGGENDRHASNKGPECCDEDDSRAEEPQFESQPLPSELPSTTKGYAKAPRTLPERKPDDATGPRPKHLMMVTRGTRGDVQPFVALARGLAETHGWQITLVTEIKCKDLVLAHSKVKRGSIQFRPSGGDTQRRVDSKIAKWAIHLKSDAMQRLMLANSEREFFDSEPAVFYWADKLKPDLLMFGFTMASVSMLVSEALRIPLLGFVLQPTSIPSTQYPPLVPLSAKAFERQRERHDLAEHDSFNSLKHWVETRNVNSMRRRRGLRPLLTVDPTQSILHPRHVAKAKTWQTLQELNFPLIVPINETLFGGKPSDWSENTVLTDNIYLRGDSVEALSAEHQAFIRRARVRGRRLVAMAFSSMPVSRKEIIRIALKIIEGCSQPVSVIALAGSHMDDLDRSPAQEERLARAVNEGQLLLTRSAPFGNLFPLMDTIIVHGGLGTTSEAILAQVPVIVTGVLLFDQRFWGFRCHELNVGPAPVHITDFARRCGALVSEALKPDSPWLANAKALGQRLRAEAEADPAGVRRNVDAVVELAERALPFTYVDGPVSAIATAGRLFRNTGKEVVRGIRNTGKAVRRLSSSHSPGSASAGHAAPLHSEHQTRRSRKRSSTWGSKSRSPRRATAPPSRRSESPTRGRGSDNALADGPVAAAELLQRPSGQEIATI